MIERGQWPKPLSIREPVMVVPMALAISPRHARENRLLADSIVFGAAAPALAASCSSRMMGQGGCMAMEDACGLADCLSAWKKLPEAFADYVARRQPRVKWVEQESAAAAESFRLPPATRNRVLQEQGDQILRHPFAPPLAAP
jgi:hypothetical protein